jgi:hypothetical protein
VHPANKLEITQALRSFFHGTAKKESLIQRRKGGARHFTGNGFITDLSVRVYEFQAVDQDWSARSQFQSA